MKFETTAFVDGEAMNFLLEMLMARDTLRRVAEEAAERAGCQELNEEEIRQILFAANILTALYEMQEIDRKT